MALPEIEKIELQYMDQWFSNVVDTVNYDLNQIEGAVGALSMKLTNIDAAPIQYLRDSLNGLVTNINKAFNKIDDQFSSLESRIKKIGG